MSTQAPAASAQAPGTETNRWVVLVLVCLAQFMVVLDATIVNVALPSIQEDLDFTPGNLAWIINSYTLLFGGFLLLGGRAADLFGRKRVFLAGVVLFSVASALCALSTSQGMLIAFRALQGLGAALVSPAALSIIMTTFADGAERTKALAVWGAIAASGSAFGLLLGGFLTESLSWEWIFIVNVPIGVAAFLFSTRLIPESKGEIAEQSFDVAGALLVTGGLVSLVYAIVKAGEDGWGSAATLGFGALGVALLVAFVLVETRHKDPLVRLGIFKTRSLSTSNGVMLVVAGGMFSMFFFATLYVQEVLGYSPLKAGLAFLPFTVGIIGGSVMAQQLIPRIGVRLQILGGLTLAVIGLLLMMRITPDGSYAAQLLPAVIVMSLGMGNTFVPLTLLATTNVDAEDAGLASGLFNTSQQVGGALGLAVFTAVSTARLNHELRHGAQPPAAFTSGLSWALTACAIAVACSAVIALRTRNVHNEAEAEALGEVAELVASN
jgi:EmrB/QacA subfamily drug resistance transporter